MIEYSEATVRVRYAETDQMGVVYHGNYFTWFEVGRVELCRALGFEYKQMESDDDSFIVVVDAHCRYKSPARFDEPIATGDTRHVICDRQGRPRSLPEKYHKYFLHLKPAT